MNTSSNNFLFKSQLFLAVCAAAMVSETYLVSGNPINLVVIMVIFFSTLFMYNASRLSLVFHKPSDTSHHMLQLHGNSLSIGICVLSVVVLFGLLTACNWIQLLIFMATALLSLCYMMPFRQNGVQLEGLRNNLILKNIILSLTWALATVSFPASANDYPPSGNEIIFMFLRRFFFIYSLAVIYDLRDLRVDMKAGMETIASRFGIYGTKLWALTSLAFFILFIFTDPALTMPGNSSISLALLLSAVFASVVIMNTHRIQNNSYYSLIVDSAMPVQFLLVLLFHQIL